MTPGTRLASLSARLLSADTFALIVSPAVADLQFEAPTGRLCVLRGYFGVWRAVAGALWFDLVSRATDLLGDEARLVTLQGAVRTWTWLALLQASYYACLFLFMADIGSHTDRGSAAFNGRPGRIIVTGAVAVLSITVVLYIVAAAAARLPIRRQPTLD